MDRELPHAVGPLHAERTRLDLIISELGVTEDPTMWADLATELVRSCSRYQNVKDRCVYPAIGAMGAADQTLASIQEDDSSIRDGMEVIRKRTAHMVPANVRADDPEGFDNALDGLLDAIQRLLEREERDLFPLLDNLSPDAADDLADNVTKALKHVSQKPNPSHNPIGRAIENLGAKLTFEDASTPRHPGRDKLDEVDIA